MNCGACVWIVVRVQVEACVYGVGIQCQAPLLIELQHARLAVVAERLVVLEVVVARARHASGLHDEFQVGLGSGGVRMGFGWKG